MMKSPAKEAVRRNSLSVSFDPSEEVLESKRPASVPIRRRSISNPLGEGFRIDTSTYLQDLKAMSKLSDISSEKSPSLRYLEGLSTLSPAHKYKSRQTFDRQIGEIGKGVLCVEYTDIGTGDFRTPSLVVVDNFNGSAISPLRYRSHKIFKGKPPIEGMPSIRCHSELEATTLVVTMADANSGLEVDLIYGKPAIISKLLYFAVANFW
jgi:hypothetical protein